MPNEKDHTTSGSCIMPLNFSFNSSHDEAPKIYVDHNIGAEPIISVLGTQTKTYTHNNFGWKDNVKDPAFIQELGNHFNNTVIFTTDEKRDLRQAAIGCSGTLTVCVLSQTKEQEILERLIKTQPFRRNMQEWPLISPWVRATQTQIRYYDPKTNNFKTRYLK